jgi:DNA invertase Pin-like site-specific DNA recombinase
MTQHNNSKQNGLVAQPRKAAIYVRAAAGQATRLTTDIRQLTTEILYALAHDHGFADTSLVVYNDSGLPATAPLEKREGLQALLSAIEQGEITTIFIYGEYSLWRHADEGDVAGFIALCQRQEVTLITPTGEYDFTNPVHVRFFHYRLASAADTLLARKTRGRSQSSQQKGQNA